jgi:hypothetical protein
MKKTSEYMATITLSYDARNKIARSIVKMMEDSGLFSFLQMEMVEKFSEQK